MLRNLDTIYDIARSSKNFSTGINFSENFFLVYRGRQQKENLSEGLVSIHSGEIEAATRSVH